MSKDIDHKQQGNIYFQKKEYESAIVSYTRAIEKDNINHILYSNRSASYLELGEYDMALFDAEKCIRLEPSWAKGYFRKGVALERLSRFNDAYMAYNNGLTIESNDPLLKKACADLSILMDEMKLSSIEATKFHNPEQDRFTYMLNWLKEGGSKFPKLFLQYYSEDYRGVHCASRIPEDEVVLEVPLKLIMTSEIAKASPIGELMVEAEKNGLELRSKHSFLAGYLLSELPKGESSYWYPYLATLPKKYRNMPIFFDEDELSWLKGSMCLEKIAERKQSLKAEFDNICKYVPGFAEFHFDDFVWARLVVITRIFGLFIDGVKTDGLVPMADMLNHKRPRETKWTYDECRGGFTITSLKPMQRGDQIFDSYGQKCNSRFFVNYGFALEENETDNEIMFIFDVPKSDLHYAMKLRFLGGNPRSAVRDFQIPISYKEKKTKEAFSFLRFSHARDAELMLLSASDAFKLDDIEPVSIRNEIEVLNSFKSCATRLLSQYETSLEHDDELLNDTKLTSNQRTCVIVRRGEKQVLKYYCDLADKCIPMFVNSWSNLKKIVAKCNDGKFDTYILNVVAPLVKKKN